MRSTVLPLVIAAVVGAAAPACADGGKAPAHKITQSKSFIMIEPFYATVYDAGRPAGLLMVAIGLDIPNDALRSEADRGTPLLRDDYLRSLTSFAANAVHPLEQPDVTEIASRLQQVTDRALHRKGARVLLAQVAIRPTR